MKEKITNIFYRAILIFSIICFYISLIAAVFFYINHSNNYLNPAVLIIGSIIYLLLISKIYKFILGLDEKRKKITVWILLIMQFIFLLISISLIKVIPEVDLIHILTGINSLNHTGTLINSEYFSIYQNNRFLLVLLYSIQKIIPIKVSLLFSLLSVFCVSTMSFFIYKTVEKLYGIDKGLLSLFICVLSPIFYLYAPYYYTDILLLPFSTILIYLIVKNKDQEKINNNIIYNLIIGIVAGIGYEIRAVAIFILIAYFIYLVITSKKLTIILQKVIPSIVGLMIVIVCITSINNNFFKNSDNNRKFPMTHWIMMGVNEYHYGYFNKTDYELSYNTKDLDDRARLNEFMIKKRIENLSPFDFLRLSISKITSVWSRGDYSYQKYLYLQKEYNSSYQYLIGDKNIIINYLLQFSKISILVLSILSLTKLFKTKEKSFIAIAIFGAIIFYLIWEVCPRYGFSFLPWLIILISYSYENLDYEFSGIRLYKPLKYVLMSLTIVIFILNYNKYTAATIKDSVVSKDTIRNHNYVNLGRGDEITQSLKLDNKFNIIKLKFRRGDFHIKSTYKIELFDHNNKVVYNKKFDKSGIKRHGYNNFKLNKTLSAGKYFIRISNENDDMLDVCTAEKEEFDYYPDGYLKINNIKTKKDLMFEVINRKKRAIYKKSSYILVAILSIFIEYLVLFNVRLISKKGIKDEQKKV